MSQKTKHPKPNTTAKRKMVKMKFISLSKKARLKQVYFFLYKKLKFKYQCICKCHESKKGTGWLGRGGAVSGESSWEQREDMAHVCTLSLSCRSAFIPLPWKQRRDIWRKESDQWEGHSRWWWVTMSKGVWHTCVRFHDATHYFVW